MWRRKLPVPKFRESESLRQKEAPRHRPKEESDGGSRSNRAKPLSRLKADQAEAEIFSNAKTTTKRPKSRVEILTQPRDENNLAQYYSSVGKVLRKAGVTFKDLLQGYQRKGEPDDDTTTVGQTRGKPDRDDDLHS